MTKHDDKHKQQTIQRIAREVFWLETLEERGCDELDFKEVSVHQVRRALQQAYDAGRDAGRHS